jgi:hypothetical protein
LESARWSLGVIPLLKPETIERAVIRGDVDAPVSDRQSAEVIKGSDLVAAGVQLFSGFRVQGVQNGVCGMLDVLRAVVVEAALGVGLFDVFAVAISEDNTISNYRRLG